jgi:hypothetical protein
VILCGQTAGAGTSFANFAAIDSTIASEFTSNQRCRFIPISPGMHKTGMSAPNTVATAEQLKAQSGSLRENRSDLANISN